MPLLSTNNLLKRSRNEPKIVLSWQEPTEGVKPSLQPGVEQTLISLLLRVENFSVTKSLVRDYSALPSPK